MATSTPLGRATRNRSQSLRRGWSLWTPASLSQRWKQSRTPAREAGGERGRTRTLLQQLKTRKPRPVRRKKGLLRRRMTRILRIHFQIMTLEQTKLSLSGQPRGLVRRVPLTARPKTPPSPASSRQLSQQHWQLGCQQDSRGVSAAWPTPARRGRWWWSALLHMTITDGLTLARKETGWLLTLYSMLGH